MAGPWKTGWQRVRRNLRNRLASGMIVLVPIGVTLLVMRWVLGGVVALFQPLVEKMAVGLSAAPDMAHIPVQAIRISLMIVSILGFLLAVYLTGAMAHVMVGRRLIRAGEGVLMRVPLASTIYMAAKQVIEAVAAPTQSAFRTVVLVEFPRQDAWSIGFLTGRLGETESSTMVKVFVPTAPNPTTGFFLIVPSSAAVTTDLTVEEAFKMIISGGIVTPAALDGRLAAAWSSGSAAGEDSSPAGVQSVVR